MQQAAKSTLVLGCLAALLVVVGLWGWHTATAPFPGKSDPPRCVETPVGKGDKVFPEQVTVSVYNASEVNGLAGRTLDLFAKDGFNKGVTGNAPRDTHVQNAAIWTTTPDSPDVRLVATRLGRGVDVVRKQGRGFGVTVVVGDDFDDLVKGKKSVVATGDAEICSPPVA
jgi:hypothetical protein